MKRFATTLKAIDNTDGLIKTFVGIDIYAWDHREAKNIIKRSYPYLTLLGEIVKEFDEETGEEFNKNLN